jgi:pyruvate/2-oxoglutarate dehydrogenase complex dihydrolipoamide acyltransferase (E2) component
MPQMGVSVTEGTIACWYKEVGDSVAEGDVLGEIVTDKVDTELLAPTEGMVAGILAAVGETVPVGAGLMELVSGSGTNDHGPDHRSVTEEYSDSGAQSPKPGAGDPPRAPVEAVIGSPGASTRSADDVEVAIGSETQGRNGTRLSSPVARRLAVEQQIDLAAVRGSGRDGRIRKADVLAALALRDGGRTSSDEGRGRPDLPPGYTNVPYELVPTSPQRRAIAEHMVRSRRTSAHMTTEVDVNMHRVTRVRRELNERRQSEGEDKLSFLPFIARAACETLREFPDLNATFSDACLIRWRQVNLSVAVDTDRGLLVPVIRGCERLTVSGIGDALTDLAQRARTRKLAPDDVAGGTFTISNPGSVGAASAMAIINQPQVGILGIPAIVRRPWVVEGPDGEEVIVPRPIMRLALTFDHRAIDGADATRCVVRIKEHLQGWEAPAYT